MDVTRQAPTQVLVTVQNRAAYLREYLVLASILRARGIATEVYLEPVGNAKMWLLTKPLPEAAPPKKGEKFVIGDVFETKFFGGKYKLYDDGRRSGTLDLEVDPDGKIMAGPASPSSTPSKSCVAQ